MNEHKTRSDLPPGVGRSETFPTGRLTFLSPKPLPTAEEPIDYSHVVTDIGESCLDFGTGVPPVFGWQMTLGGPFGLFLLIALIFPLIGTGLFQVHGIDDESIQKVFWTLFDYGFPGAIGGSVFVFFLLSLPRWHAYGKLAKFIPTRFNRQRREVCFVPNGQTKPVYVPWEDLLAWVTQAQGVTEYGVQQQYGLGIGFDDPETGSRYSLEFEASGLPQAIGTWEAIRAYMEYEVHTLKEIQDPLDLQGPDDPPWEGVHVFRNARKRAHNRYREGDVGLFYLVGWYLYHMMTFWTVPNRLVEWEAKKFNTMNRRAMPESMQRWSDLLPESQWAKPSDELKRQSERVRGLLKAHPAKSTLEIFSQVSDELDAKASLTA